VSNRLTRQAILGLLLLTLVSGSVVSTGAIAGSVNCCCRGGKCPSADPEQADTARCCESSTPAPSPIAEAGQSFKSTSETAHRTTGDGLVTPVRRPPIVSTLDRSQGAAPPGVSLHTLHAVFLI
jgi:hypothetical protein